MDWIKSNKKNTKTHHIDSTTRERKINKPTTPNPKQTTHQLERNCDEKNPETQKKKHNFCESQDRNQQTLLLFHQHTPPLQNSKPDGHHKITATQKNSPDWFHHEGEKIHKPTNPHNTKPKKLNHPPTMELPWASKKLRLHRFLEIPVRTPAEVRTSNDSPSCSSSWNPTISSVLCKIELLAPILCLSINRSIDRSSFPAC